MIKKYLLMLKPTDIIVWVGGGGTEKKIHKYNITQENIYWIDPLYDKTEGQFHRLAIGRKSEPVRIYLGKSWQNTSLFKEVSGRKNDECFWVPSMTLDSFYEQQNLDHVDWLFCNAEGAEYEIFRSSREFLKKTNNIAIDFHKIKIFDGELENIKKILKDFVIEEEDQKTSVRLYGIKKNGERK